LARSGHRLAPRTAVEREEKRKEEFEQEEQVIEDVEQVYISSGTQESRKDLAPFLNS
jgi:hypothetical protein